MVDKRSGTCRDEQGAWDAGSGQLEFWLTPEQNVLKEVKEEYGCDSIMQGQLPPHSLFRDSNGVKTHWLIIPYFILADPKNVSIGEPGKMLELAWFRLDNLPQPLHTGFKFAYQNFKKYFKEYV